MDPLSDVLSLLKPQSYISGSVDVSGDLAVQFPKHPGIKCYALLSGQCWLSVEGVPDPVLLTAGDCFLLPRGLPFCLATDLSLAPVDFNLLRSTRKSENAVSDKEGRSIAGGHFVLTGGHAEILLKSLPPIVHIRKESDKAAMRWSLERMREELRDPQPGGSLIAQQLAYMMLIQALRLHLADAASSGVGWLFALADKQMSAAITCMHDDPGHRWTLQELGGARWDVAVDICSKVQRDRRRDPHGVPDTLAHAAGRRQAEKFRRFYLPNRLIARLRVRKRLRQSLQKGHGIFPKTIQPPREQPHASGKTCRGHQVAACTSPSVMQYNRRSE